MWGNINNGSRINSMRNLTNKTYVLIIEDEIEISNMISEEFQALGHITVQAESLNEAMSKASNQEFSVIVLDMKLKKGSGDEFVKNIRSDKKHINFSSPIVVASGCLTGSILSEISGDISHAFVKPYDMGNLVKKCEELMAASASDSAAA